VAAASSTPLVIRSAEDHVYEALRDQIVRGLPPLSPLRLTDIAAEFAVSTMPVRVALRRLEAENLVVTLPRRGSQVAPLRLADIEEIQTVRVRVEGLAALLGAPNVDDAGLARMRKQLTALRHAVAKNDIDDYLTHGSAFEDVCYEAAGWPRLLRLVQEMRRSAERYLRIAVAGGGENMLSQKFWERFYDAVAEHDGPQTEAVLTEALLWTLDSIRAQLEADATSPLR
jgi:DNA-binding GntR family transcriptional regulator